MAGKGKRERAAKQSKAKQQQQGKRRERREREGREMKASAAPSDTRVAGADATKKMLCPLTSQFLSQMIVFIYSFTHMVEETGNFTFFLIHQYL